MIGWPVQLRGSSYDARSRVTSARAGEANDALARETRYRYESSLDPNTTESGPVEETESGWASVLAGGPEAPGATDRALVQMAWNSLLSLTSIRKPDEQTIGFRHDDEGRLAGLTPPARTEHAFSYSGFGSVATYTAPNVGTPRTTQYTYGGEGELELLQLADGRTIDPAFAATTGRLTSIAVSGRGTFTPTYDAAGRVRQWQSPRSDGVTGTETLSFGFDGPLTTSVSWAGSVTGTVVVDYDASLRPNSIVVRNGATPTSGTAQPALTLEYDADDALARITGPLLGTQSETLVRHPGSGLPSTTNIGRADTAHTWTRFGQLETQTATWSPAAGGQGSSLGWQYEYDGLGRIARRTETLDGAQVAFDYGYDVAGRLSRVTRNGVVVESYGFDANGNRTSATNSAGTLTSSQVVIDGQDRLLTYGSTSFTYNAAGQLATRVGPSGTTTYTYDALGNLTRVVLPSGRVVAYAVDAQNRRIGRTVRSSTAANAPIEQQQRWLYLNQLEPVAELDANGNVVAVFVYGSMPHVPDLVVRGSTVYRVVTDHLGSVRRLVNTATGEAVQSFDYDAWGRIIASSGDLALQPFRYAGGLYDAETGLTRFGARDYDPEVGRWTAKDPIGFAGHDTNLYRYVGDNPVNAFDRTGAFAQIAVAAFIGGAIDVGLQLARNGGDFSGVNWSAAAVSAATAAISATGAGFLVNSAMSLGRVVAVNSAVNALATVGGRITNNLLGNNDRPCGPATAWHDGVVLAGASGAASGAVGGAIGFAAGHLARSAANQSMATFRAATEGFSEAYLAVLNIAPTAASAEVVEATAGGLAGGVIDVFWNTAGTSSVGF